MLCLSLTVCFYIDCSVACVDPTLNDVDTLIVATWRISMTLVAFALCDFALLLRVVYAMIV